jgi:hypothetical protein
LAAIETEEMEEIVGGEFVPATSLKVLPTRKSSMRLVPSPVACRKPKCEMV